MAAESAWNEGSVSHATGAKSCLRVSDSWQGFGNPESRRQPPLPPTHTRSQNQVLRGYERSKTLSCKADCFELAVERIEVPKRREQSLGSSGGGRRTAAKNQNRNEPEKKGVSCEGTPPLTHSMLQTSPVIKGGQHSAYSNYEPSSSKLDLSDPIIFQSVLEASGFPNLRSIYEGIWSDTPVQAASHLPVAESKLKSASCKSPCPAAPQSTGTDETSPGSGKHTKRESARCVEEAHSKKQRCFDMVPVQQFPGQASSSNLVRFVLGNAFRSAKRVRREKAKVEQDERTGLAPRDAILSFSDQPFKALYDEKPIDELSCIERRQRQLYEKVLFDLE